MMGPTKIFGQIDREDKDAIKKAQLSILDMVRVKIEEGNVESLAFILIAKDPVVPGGPAYTGTRFLIHPSHLDILDDTYKQMLNALIQQYGVTPDELRQDRARGAKK